MPRKKSKKSKSKDEQVLEVNPEIEIEKAQDENKADKSVEVNGLDSSVQDNKEISKNEIQIDSQSNKETLNVPSDSESRSSEKVGKKSMSLRKRLSFSKNKRSKMSTSSIEGSENEDNSIRRTKSMSSHDSSKSKIPIGKFRSLHFSRKKKNNANISSSCGNFDGSKSNHLTNPETDAWRMNGLLNAVTKSNSMIAINTESSEPVSVVVYEENHEQEKTEISKPNLQLNPSVSSQVEEPKLLKDLADEEKRLNDEENEGDVTQTTVDSSVASETIPEEDETDEKIPTSPAVENSSPSKKVVIKIKVEDKKEETKNILSAKNFTPTEKASPNDVKALDITPGDVMTSDVNDTTTTSEDTYEINEEQTITVRQLCDVLAENNIDLPNDIVASDWLVLNLSPSRSAIATC